MSKALIVDDSRAIRMIVARALRELGYETAEAANGREALEVIGPSASVDLVLADWNMPVMNGLELLQELRGSAAHRHMPVIMVTTEAEADQMMLALQAGATEYIMKPFTKEILADKLRLAGLA